MYHCEIYMHRSCGAADQQSCGAANQKRKKVLIATNEKSRNSIFVLQLRGKKVVVRNICLIYRQSMSIISSSSSFLLVPQKENSIFMLFFIREKQDCLIVGVVNSRIEKRERRLAVALKRATRNQSFDRFIAQVSAEKVG